MGGGAFVKIWKMGGFVKKSGKHGVFCKKVDLSLTHDALSTVSVFFLILLFYLFGEGGCVRSPLPTGMSENLGETICPFPADGSSIQKSRRI